MSRGINELRERANQVNCSLVKLRRMFRSGMMEVHYLVWDRLGAIYCSDLDDVERTLARKLKASEQPSDAKNKSEMKEAMKWEK
jgi:hypothetical protein